MKYFNTGPFSNDAIFKMAAIFWFLTCISGLGYCKTCSNPEKNIKLGMLVDIGHRKKIKVVAKMTYTYEDQRSRSK